MCRREQVRDNGERAAQYCTKCRCKTSHTPPQLKPQAYTWRLNFDVDYSSVSTFQHAALGAKHCFSGWPQDVLTYPQRAHMRACISIAILLAYCACAFALDPALDVSQYAHTAWRMRDGFVKRPNYLICPDA